jgi:cytidyltransferase-like protein
MMNKKTKLFTVGVFDFFHYGHLMLFERIKKLGDYLIVAVEILVCAILDRTAKK